MFQHISSTTYLGPPFAPASIAVRNGNVLFVCHTCKEFVHSHSEYELGCCFGGFPPVHHSECQREVMEPKHEECLLADGYKEVPVPGNKEEKGTMYTITKLLDGTFWCEGRLQDSTERWSKPTLEEAVASMKSFALTGNGMKIKKKRDITYLQQLPPDVPTTTLWRPFN